MELFFIEGINKKIALGLPIVFSESESNHIKNVFRKRVGDRVWATDGKGLKTKIEINDCSKKQVEGIIIDYEQFSPLNYSLHIGIAPPKNNSRFEWFLEKIVEIGNVSKITPIVCVFSERKVINRVRCQKIIQSALKQSLHCFMPEIKPVTSFTSFVKENKGGYVAHCHPFEKKDFFKEIKISKNINILIGPEGDFTIDEVKLAKENKYISVSLGEFRLRIETAGILSCHSVFLKNSNFRR